MFKTIPWRRYRSGLILAAVALMLASIAIIVPAGAQQETSGTDSSHVPASPILEEEALPDVIGEGSASIATDGLIRPMAQSDGVVRNLTATAIGATPGTPLVDGDDFRFDGEWDASGMGLQEGDTFIIDFGEGSVEISTPTIYLEDSSGNHQGFVWGECTVNDLTLWKYDCVINNIPEGENVGYGTFWGTAKAVGTGGPFDIQARAGGSITLDKRGDLVSDMAGHPRYSVARFDVALSSTDWTAIYEDVILTDSFSSNLKVCDITDNMRVNHNFNTVVQPTYTTSDNEMTITIPRPDGGFGDDMPSENMTLTYWLCTTSGDMDPSGTVYENTISTIGSSSYREFTQFRDAGGDASGITSGSFALRKVVDPASIPAGFNPTVMPFTITVQEYEPGSYEAGSAPENEYDVQVFANSSNPPTTGWTERPDGWTIRLSENIDQLPSIPDHNWGTPVFSGAGVDTGVDEAGNPFALIATNSNSNVEVSLENFISSDEPETGISFPLPETGDGLALWVLFAVTGAGLVGGAVFMVRNNRSRKLSEEDDS